MLNWDIIYISIKKIMTLPPHFRIPPHTTGMYSGAKKYLVSHQLCKFSHLKRWERLCMYVIVFCLIDYTVEING